MARKRIAIEENGPISAKVYRDSDWGEYIVRLYDRGNLIESADYFTDDKQDSIDTARAMVSDWNPAVIGRA